MLLQQKSIEKKSLKTMVASFYEKVGVLVILFIMVLLLTITTPAFLSVTNLTNVLRQISFTAIIGFGVLSAILTCGIDLSLGSIVGVVSIITAKVLASSDNVLLGILAGIGIGVLAGAINGGLIAFTGISPFVATLGMTTIARGTALVISASRPVTIKNEAFNFIGTGSIGFIPIPIIIMVLLALLTSFLLNYTRYGRHVYAIGGNEQAAIISGINIKRVKFIIYTYSGFLTAVSSIVLSARINSGQPGLGVGFELDAIAAAVIGGTSFSGGIGTVFGVISGALVIGVLNNGMDLVGISAYWQQIAKGIIIISAVILDVVRTRISSSNK